eukprot:745260-Rhodomonas_salina.1
MDREMTRVVRAQLLPVEHGMSRRKYGTKPTPVLMQSHSVHLSAHPKRGTTPVGDPVVPGKGTDTNPLKPRCTTKIQPRCTT